MTQLYKGLKEEEGVTLVEILAAIAILSIIVTAFLAFFIQAGNTNNRTDRMNEATFLAQNEMEEVTIYSYENRDVESVKKSYFKGNNTRKKIADNGMIIETEIHIPEEETTIYKVTVKVWEGDDLLATMETRLPYEHVPTNN